MPRFNWERRTEPAPAVEGQTQPMRDAIVTAGSPIAPAAAKKPERTRQPVDSSLEPVSP